MRRVLPLWLSLLSNLQSHRASGQDWELIGLRDYFWQIKQVYADSTNDALYACGTTAWLPDTGMSFYRLQQSDWDTLGLFDQTVWTCVVWHDTLIASGSFHSVNGDSIKYIAFWDTAVWQPYGQSPLGVQRFKILNNELYALGGFDEADSQPATGIAKRVGDHWEPLPPMQNTDFVSIADIAFYQGHVVAVGNIHFTGNPYADVMILNSDSTWSPIGPVGLSGGFSGASGCAVYQGDLYVCGYISVNDGNAGQGIIRWDGSQWHDVGGGLTWAPSDFSITCQATEMKVHDDLLFVSSGCHYAGNVPASGIAIWDGLKWCGLGDSLPQGCMTFDFLNDTLYANVLQWQDTIFNTVVKYLRPDYADTCGGPLGIDDPGGPVAYPSAWVNGQGLLVATGLTDGMQLFELFDGAGRRVLDIPVLVEQGHCEVSPSRSLSPGIYFLRVSSDRVLKLVVP